MTQAPERTEAETRPPSRLAPVADGAVNVILREPGRFFAMSLDTIRAMFKWPFQWREFLQQAWFIVSVTVAPTILVAIPFSRSSGRRARS